MNRRAFLRNTSAGALLAATGCHPDTPTQTPKPPDRYEPRPPDPNQPAPLPVAKITYADPNAVPAKPSIPSDWTEHRSPHKSASMAYLWADIILESAAREVIANGFPRPTVISRYMGMACTAMYDAWACYDAKAVGTRLLGKLRRPAREHTDANKAIAIGHAVYKTLADLFPADLDWLTDQARQMKIDPADTSTDPAKPAGIGNLVAAALVDYRHHDGANALGDEVGSTGEPYSDWTYYEPRNPVGKTTDPDRWQPIEFDSSKPGGKPVTPGFLNPHWYRVKLIALDRSDQFRPGPQPKVGSAQLKKEVEDVIAFNGGLSLEQKSIVEFMRDGPRSTGQSGHWMHFAQDVSRRDKHDLDRDVKMFFCVANTAFETFIAAWDAKRFYDSARPFALVRLVQELFAGNRVVGYLGPGLGFGTIPADKWHPYSPGTFRTPPFPGYVSGHSCVSGGCAKMLELFTGNDKFGVFYNHVAGQFTEPGADVAAMQSVDGKPATGLPADKRVTLVLPTFSATSDMAGLSRVMGGYHIQSDNIEGLKLGRGVAEYGWKKYQAYFDGTALVRS